MNKITLIYFIIFPFNTFCQTISGKIENINGEKIPFANVVIKDSINTFTIKEFTIAKNGYYSVTLIHKYKSLVVEVSANKYQNDYFVIDSFDENKNYVHNFFLVKDTIFKLKEVVVTAKTKPFQIKGDTVSYNVSAYRDGTERKIQDVIKKLPGIDVNEKTGEIKYKGKTVETVKLDGDDLFASNYSIGTRNINVDMVEQVQAIENYSDNPLLKGIESGDKVALNLTLKKKKTDYSGNIDIGLGLLASNKAAIDASTNLLGISKKYKSFATLSYNNIGINNSPFDYFSYNPNMEQLNEANFLAKRFIPDTYFDIDIDARRSNINNAFFGSYNAVFKMGKRVSLKTNFYYLNDRVTSRQTYINKNNINGQEFTTSDIYSIRKIPTQYRGDVEMKYNTSPKSLLEYKVRYRKEQISTTSGVLQNELYNYNTKLNTRDNFLKQSLTHTFKLTPNKAFQIIINHSINNAPQNYGFVPAIYAPLFYESNNQLSKFKKNNLSVQAILLGSTSKDKYTISFGSDIENTSFYSDLTGYNNGTETSISSFINKFQYYNKSLYNSFNYKLQLNRWRFNPSVTTTYLKQSLQDNASGKVKDAANFIIEPTFSISYKLNENSVLLVTPGYKQKPFSEDYFIENPVYISNRLIKSNDVSLELQQSKFISAFYFVNNLYKQFQLNISGSYLENRGNYFSKLTIQPNSTQIQNFFLPERNKLLSMNFLIEKYVPFLEGTIRLKSDYSVQYYKNIVNNSALRNNSTKYLANELFFKTAFDGKINFENIIKYRILTSATDSGFTFSNQSLNNKFQVITRPSKRLLFFITTDYYLPNTKKTKQAYFFIDASLNYSTKKKIYDFRFIAKNLSNNNYFSQIATNDFSTTIFQTNLLPRHFIFSVSRNF